MRTEITLNFTKNLYKIKSGKKKALLLKMSQIQFQKKLNIKPSDIRRKSRKKEGS